mgnify:CR=1 FL=1
MHAKTALHFPGNLGKKLSRRRRDTGLLLDNDSKLSPVFGIAERATLVMKYSHLPSGKYSIPLFLLVVLVLIFFVEGAEAAKKGTAATKKGTAATKKGAAAAKKETFDIIYLRTKDFEKVLDYKEELETILEPQVRKKLKLVSARILKTFVEIANKCCTISSAVDKCDEATVTKLTN